MILKDKIYINTKELGYKISALCELFTYKNPEIFHKKRLKLAITGIPSHLYHYRLVDINGEKILQIPRGGLDKVLTFYKEHSISYRILDQRIEHPQIDVSLKDTTLQEQQTKIIDILIKNEGGLIEAAPGAGKSIAILGLISIIKQPTLILMHELRLSDQWIGEIKKRLTGNFILGKYDGTIKEDGDIVVGIINSAYNKFQEDASYFEKFGMVIIDECLDPKTKITVPNGIKLLEDIEIGDEVITPTGVARVKNKWITQRDAFEYVTTNFNSIIASSNHIVPTYNDPNSGIIRGISNKNIKDAQCLLFPRRLPKERIIDYTFDFFNYLYGWYLGDGTCDRNVIKFGFSKIYKIKAFEEMFLKYNIYKKSTNSRGDTIFTLNFEISQKLINKYNIKHGKKDVTMELPDLIYKTSDLSFLKGIFDTDGYSLFKAGNQKQTSICLDLTLNICLFQIIDMLKSYSIYVNIFKIRNSRKNKKRNDSYRLRILGENINKFNKLIGFRVSNKIISNVRGKVNNSPYNSAKIRKVNFLGKRELIDIELDNDEKLFIANGFIVHNCQHLPSQMFLSVINNIPAKYRIGVSGTIERRDGKELLTYDVIGKTLIKIKAPELKHRITDFDFKIVNTNIPMELEQINRWTGKKRENVLDMTKSLTKLVENNGRNNIIISETIDCINQGHFPLILSSRIKHNEFLYESLTNLGINTVLLIGKTRKKSKWEDIQNNTEIQCIVANEKIASEGLDYPRLSALIVTCPTSNTKKLEQQLGRIRRVFPNKPMPLVVDLCDNLVYITAESGPNYLLAHMANVRYRLYRELKEQYNA